MMHDDQKLLHEFAFSRSETAFGELVTRHLPLVHSAALRRVNGDAHLAGEIAQSVFIILARKAGSIGPEVVLAGWLYRTAHYVATDAIRQNFRRREREHEAYLESTMNQPDTGEAWKQIAPILDEAMNTLRDSDRDAVLLRYFQDKPLAEVGAVLGVSEDAARVRVSRALEKLRSLLTKKGVTLGTAAIAGAVTANSVTAAPTTLAITVTTTALTGTTLTLTTIAMTTFQKIAVTAALTVTIGGGLYAAKQAQDAKNETSKIQAQQMPMREQLQRLQSDLVTASNTIADLNGQFARNQKDNSELLKLRGEVGVLRSRLADQNTAAARTAVAMSATTPATTDIRNQAMLDFLGNPVPPPSSLDGAYTKEGLINAVQTAAQSANISLKHVEVDDSEFPFVIGVVADKDGDLELLQNMIKGMDKYEYPGSISSHTTMVMNITPRSIYPRVIGGGIDNRLALRQNMLYNKIQNSN